MKNIALLLLLSSQANALSMHKRSSAYDPARSSGEEKAMKVLEKASVRDFDVFGDKKEHLKKRRGPVPPELEGTKAAEEYLSKKNQTQMADQLA